MKRWKNPQPIKLISYFVLGENLEGVATLTADRSSTFFQETNLLSSKQLSVACLELA